MKCFFNLSSGNEEYYEMAGVLIHSALCNTSLQLFCINDGIPKTFIHWMQKHGVTVLDWSITFLEDLKANYDGEKDIGFCRGTYLCMELPKIIRHYGVEDKYVLYTDIDIIFDGEITLNDCKPTLFASSTDWEIDDWSRFSTGVMVMNIDNLLKHYSKFLMHVKKHKYNFAFAGMGPCDQGAWNTYFDGRNEKLSQIYDWKPWWGINKDARIIHFSGPKPRSIEKLLSISDSTNLTDAEQLHLFVINKNRKAFKKLLAKWKNNLVAFQSFQ